MNVFDLVASLTLDTGSYDSALARARNSASVSSGDVSRSFRSIGRAATLVGGVIVGEAAIGVKAAADFESAFTGAMKTISFEAGTSQAEIDAFFESLKAGILEMSHRLPQSAEEIAGVAEAAGQLGIENDKILEFAEVMLGLGSATNLSAQDAATALARFANVTRMDQNDFDKLGSSIVALGNDTATTESEIVHFMQNLANLSNIANFSEADIAALAATMSSTGARAEITRTTFENLALTINDAVAEGGESLFQLARVSHRTSADFAKTWRSDPMKALELFINGLNDLNFEENEQIGILESLGISQTLRQQAIIRLVGAHEKLTKNIKLSNDEYKENGKTLEEYNALQTEVAKRNKTLESQWSMFKNSLKEVAIGVGDALIPALKNLLEAMIPIVNNIANFVKEHPQFIQRLSEIGLGLLGIGAASSGIEHIINLLTTFSSQTALTVMGIIALVTVLGTLAMMYRGELGNFFSQLGHYFDNVRIGIEQLRLIIENLDWGALGTYLGESLMLGIANAINRGIGWIENAINGVIGLIEKGINGAIDDLNSNLGGALNLFQIGTKGEDGKYRLGHVDFGEVDFEGIDTSDLEKDVEKQRKQILNGKNNYESVREELDRLNKLKDENDKAIREGSWWGDEDYNPTFQQRYMDTAGKTIERGLSWLGLEDQTEKVAGFFGLAHPKDVEESPLSQIGTVPEESTESVEIFTEAVKNAVNVVTGSEDEDVSNLTTGLQTVGEQFSEIATSTEPLTSALSETLPEAASTLMGALTGGEGEGGEGDGTLDSSLLIISEKLATIHTNTQNIINTWNGALANAIKTLQSNAEKAIKALQEIGNAAKNAAGKFNSLNDSINAVIGSIEKLNKMEIQLPALPGGGGLDLPTLPGRASGGPVNAGEPYWVGEDGPEVYVPSRGGSIISNDNLSKLGQTININMNFEGDVYGDEASFTKMVTKTCKEAIKEAVYAGA